jgi:drug/metabolite transporter (DMT)-like permease
LFFGILAVSTASIFIRFAQANVQSLVIAAYRLTFASLILFPYTLSKNGTELRRLTKSSYALALLSGALLALHFATWITSLQYTSVASSVVLVTTTPLWVALFSAPLLRERIPRLVLVGLIVALLGSSIVGIADSCKITSDGLACPTLSEFIHGQAFLGDFLALSGAWFAAGYLMIGRKLRMHMSLPSYTFLVYGMAAVVLIMVVLVSRLPVSGYPPLTYLWLLALAVIPQLFGHSVFNWSLKYLPAAYVSISLLGEPIGSTILAYFLLGEVPNVIKLIGGGLILIGIYIASRGQPE